MTRRASQRTTRNADDRERSALGQIDAAHARLFRAMQYAEMINAIGRVCEHSSGPDVSKEDFRTVLAGLSRIGDQIAKDAFEADSHISDAWHVMTGQAETQER